MSETVIGLLHPGEMGAAIGGALVAAGHTVLWASEGRSTATGSRAAAAGLSDTGTAGDLARRSAVLLSICPPHAALEVAQLAAGFSDGIFVDANAIAPATAHQVRGIVESPTVDYVDGGIIGPPPVDGAGGTGTRLYLSGERAPEVAELFTGTDVEARLADGGPAAASALKMAYAAWSKGAAALILAARALAHAEQVEDMLLEEWALSRPGLADRSQAAARSATSSGWRWTGEMEEIAASMAAAGLPTGFHQAAAEIFRRPARDETPGGDEATAATVISALLAGGQQPTRRSPR
ncbi:MAG TPA: DUF1932 domain-containing protein [Streptosporangiaceae bacterium]|nr:DUF1932 domain-containing protein [Streptosporangiaceae bacterium]